MSGRNLVCADMSMTDLLHDLTIPVPSQVVVARTLSKQQQLMSVATKIAIQMNCKLGGEAWALEIPVSIFSPSAFVEVSVLPTLDLNSSYSIGKGSVAKLARS